MILAAQAAGPVNAATAFDRFRKSTTDWSVSSRRRSVLAVGESYHHCDNGWIVAPVPAPCPGGGGGGDGSGGGEGDGVGVKIGTWMLPPAQTSDWRVFRAGGLLVLLYQHSWGCADGSVLDTCHCHAVQSLWLQQYARQAASVAMPCLASGVVYCFTKRVYVVA